EAGGVATGSRHAADEARADRINDYREHDRHAARYLQQRPQSRSARGEDDIRRKGHQFGRVSARIVYVAPGKSVVDLDVLSDGPAQLLQSLQESGVADLCLRIVRGVGHEGADTPNALALLRPRRERPCGRRAAKQRYERAPLHSITSSAPASRLRGTMRPSA